MTLTGRDDMRFHMLIGRTTMKASGFSENPAPSSSAVQKVYKQPKRSEP